MVWVLIPVLIVLAVVFGVASLIGLLGSQWPWLLIAAGIWMFWHEDGRHRHRRRRAAQAWEPRTVPVRPTAPQPEAKKKEPTPIKSRSKPELPIDMQVKVEQIRRKVEVLLSYADRFPPFSKDLYIVRATASEYLPRTISAYLALSPQTANAPLTPGGQTPSQELKAQLDLLDAKLDEIAQDLQRQDIDRLLANRQFLEERFGRAASA